MAVHEVYFIRKEALSGVSENYELVRLSLDTQEYTGQILNVGAAIQTGQFKVLQQDIPGNYLIFACKPVGSVITRTYIHDIQAQTTTEITALRQFDFLTLSDVYCIYDINGLVFIVIKDTNTLITMTIRGESYVDEQTKIVAEANYATSSMFSTGYNGLLYFTQKNDTTEQRKTCSFHVNIQGDAARTILEDNYTDNRHIVFIDATNNKIYTESEQGVVYDYTGTRYWTRTSLNNADYIDIMYRPNGGAEAIFQTVSKELDSNFTITEPNFQYAFYDIDDRIVFFNTRQQAGYFQYVGILVSLSTGTITPFIPVLGRGGLSYDQSGNIGIGFDLTNVLAYNHFTSRYVLQPSVLISYKQPFYDIDEELKINYIVDVPADRTQTVDVVITLSRDGAVLVTDTITGITPSPTVEHTYSFTTLTPAQKVMGVYTVNVMARITSA